MIWAILWIVYLAIGCALIWPVMDESAAEFRWRYGNVSAPLMFVASMIFVLIWPLAFLPSDDDT